MATATITLEDLPDGTLKLSLTSDPPLQSPFTDAQLFAIASHQMLLEGYGARFSEFVPVDLLPSYEVDPLPTRA